MLNNLLKIIFNSLPIIYITIIFFFNLIDSGINTYGQLISSFLILLLFFTFIIKFLFKRDIKYIEYTLLLPLYFSPIFIAGRWVLYPAKLGVGSGGIIFFINWLTKYPNFGNINYEVALGIICVIATHSIPFIFYILYIYNKKRMINLFFILLLLSILFYLPVFIRLDFYSLHAIFSWFFLLIFTGPLERLLSIISLILIFINMYKNNDLQNNNGA